MDPKSILATLARLVLASVAGTLVKDGYLQSSGTEAFIGVGMMIATGLWGVWNSYGKDIAKASLELLQAKVLNAAARARANPTAAAPALAGVAAHVERTLPPGAPAASAAPPAASLILLAIGLSALAIAWAGPAGAATKGAPLTGNIVKDVTNAVKGQQASTGPDETSACDFNLFANLNATSVVLQIQQCLATPGAALANAFLPDVTDALASANAYGDQVGVSCLKPGLAIVQAGVGTPAAPEVPAVPATATAPEIPAVPAIAAKLPGPILIFQKFREFELAGGPAACKSWVTSTVAGAIAP